MKTILFDMDGVLFDTERISHRIWYQTAEEMKLGDIQEAAVGCIGRNQNDIKKLFLKLYGVTFPVEAFLNQATARYQEELEKHGLPVMSGAISILDYLKANNFRIGLASSSPKAVIISHLEKSKMVHYFEKIVGGDQVKHSKPLPDIYEKACRELGALPQETIAVEDSPNGIRSAYAAGLKPIMIPDLIQPDEEIQRLIYQKYDSLAEFEKALKGQT